MLVSDVSVWPLRHKEKKVGGDEDGMEEARPEANVEKHRKESAKDLSVIPCLTPCAGTQPFQRELAAFPVLVLLSQSPGKERPTQGQTSEH